MVGPKTVPRESRKAPRKFQDSPPVAQHGPSDGFEGDKESPEQFQDDRLMAQDGPQDVPNRSPNKKARQLQLQARWTPQVAQEAL